MTKSELKKLKPLLSPSQFRVVEAMQKAGRYMSYKEINEATGQTCSWKRLSEIDMIHMDIINRRLSKGNSLSCITPLSKVYNRRSRWVKSKNRFGEVVKFKQFKLV
jgi:hypothetical protein